MLIIKIKRGDCIDFRARLINKLNVTIDDRDDPAGKRTVNVVMTVVSTIFSEGMDRQELDYNTAARLKIKYNQRQHGVFTTKELKDLFPVDVEKLGPWGDLKKKTAFLVAGTCGPRRNEVRALRWENVDLENRIIRVYEAFKGLRRPGLPKWDKKRESSLPGITARHLAHLQRETARWQLATWYSAVKIIVHQVWIGGKLPGTELLIALDWTLSDAIWFYIPFGIPLQRSFAPLGYQMR